jgi:predicted transcriptional regulator
MSAKNKATANNSGVDEHQARTRLLLALWDLGGAKEGVKKGQLTKRVVQKNLKASDYQGIFEQLEKEEAIANTKNIYSLSSKGVEILGESLKNPELKFEGTIVGAWVANALIRWIVQMDGSVSTPAAQAKTEEKAIASYEEFKSQVLPLFDKLNKTHNYSELVPIWHLRRELEERVNREEFNNWMMEMQAEHLLYLQSGEARGATEDQKRDSITDDVRGLLFFASQPS